MALDARYILMQDIQELFRDKDTGLPLSGGKVYFKIDTSRNTPKPVYTLSGSPPNYTYVTVPVNVDNAVLLNSVGAFDDPIYFLPFDDAGEIELYYIEVYSSDDVFQFSREGWPNFTEDAVSSSREYNYIDNGQFLVHTDIQPDGTITGTGGVLAPNWYFVRDNASSTDLITYVENPDFQTTPPGQPRFSLRLRCTTASPGHTQKDIVKRFNNVNRFANQEITFGLYAISNAGDVTANLVLYRDYGTGGDPTEITDIAGTGFTISASWAKHDFVFTLGSTSGKNVTQDNDDYMQIGVRINPNVTSDIQLTDFYLFEGSKLNDDYPLTTNTEDKSLSMGGTIETPDYAGNSIGLPVVWTEGGFVFDTSVVGEVKPFAGLTAPPYHVFCRGDSFKRTDFSPDGIPYQRLFDVLYDSTLNYPLYGTNNEYFIARNFNNTTLIIGNTYAGTVTAASDTGSTGITFYEVGPGGVDTEQSPYVALDGFMAITSDWIGTLTATWTQTGTVVNPGTLNPVYIPTTTTEVFHELEFNSAASINAADYIQAYKSTGGGFDFFVWFKKDGAGAAPAGTGTAYSCNVLTGESNVIVAAKAAVVFRGRACQQLDFTSIATLSGGEYFSIYASSSSGPRLYVVWYSVDGTGTQPVVGGAFDYIEVETTSADTPTQITTKTMAAINSFYFKVPNPQGRFIRCWDFNAGVDINNSNRQAFDTILFGGNKLGTGQHWDIPGHEHLVDFGLYTVDAGSAQNVLTQGAPAATFIAQREGLYETVPNNIALNYIIHL